jgi:hypothetical protein
MAILLAHLLKWRFQPDRRCHSWEATIRTQRSAIPDLLHREPSLKHTFEDNTSVATWWQDGVALAESQTKLMLSTDRLWPLGQVLDDDFWPD